jgi:lipopolysaccharide transport protein LptA
VILPAALLLFIALLVVSLRDRPNVHGGGLQLDVPVAERTATGVRLKQLDGASQALDFEADVVEPQPDGGFHLEMIRRLAIAREEGGPLIVQARGAEIEGQENSRRIVAHDEVVVTDPEQGLVLRLPRLVVDEATGEARSRGEIEFEGQGLTGEASEVIYGLAGQPTQLFNPVLRDSTGAELRADRIVLLDGLNDVELTGNVDARRGVERFEADRLHAVRDEEDRLRHAEAEGGVKTRFLLEPDMPADVSADRLEVDWDEQRQPERMQLEGNARVGRAGESLTADQILAVRQSDGKLWDLTASGTVYAQGWFAGEPAWIRSEHLHATLDEFQHLQSATAEGRVRFEAPQTRSESDRAEFHPTLDGGEVRLFAARDRKARIAREQTRIAAEKITTDLRGHRLFAERRVEATLMPQDKGGEGLFRAEQAVHFVSETLLAENSGDRLVFTGNVRGWQGERNLSAEQIEMYRGSQSLAAIGGVTTRAPRETEASALGEADYVQISADRLDYDGETRLAVYRDRVRVTLSEGWMEADRIEVQLSENEGSISEVWAYENVYIEFNDPDESKLPEMVSGSADRVAYIPSARSVRLFGDEKPATVRRLGAQGATTSGRVLRYQLDEGTLEVESGEKAPARIRGR